MAQLEVLRYLSITNRFSDTVSALVDYLGATKGTLSQTVSTLERRGLLERRADAADGRVQHCVLTPKGQVVVRASHDHPAARRLLLDDGDVDHVDAVLRALLRARGGRSFGVCATCAHHRSNPEGRSCALLGIELGDDDAWRICREHEGRSAAPTRTGGT